MVDNLELHAKSAANDLARLEKVVGGLRPGRGFELGSLISFILDRFKGELAEIAGSHQDVLAAKLDSKLEEDLLQVVARKYERLQAPLDVLYETLGMYEKSVDRSDVPVGLQHLVDVLMVDLLSSRGDPMIHLDPVDMYSTVDLVAHIDNAFEAWKVPDVGSQYTGVHPIVFNLPALDPSNALLSPLIAHEVTHTAANESLLEMLEAKTGPAGQQLLDKWVHESAGSIPPVNAEEWAGLFQNWCEELICDAVALALTGPSFLFAFSAYLPPSNAPSVGTHPALRDRIAFHLEVLDQLGWTPVLDARVPNTAKWFRAASKSQPRTGLSVEGFLLEALELVKQDLIEISVQHVKRQLSPASAGVSMEPAIAAFRQGIPAIEVGQEVLETWQVVLAGWFAAFEERGDNEMSLLVALDDPNYSAMLIKALEMSSIVTKWRAIANAGA